ncbi:MAG TPA: glucokinase [Candidatus Saccharimonadia bacterium]|nr:glucokinase [Candidatus Saccharimonadia bacterium]
MGVDQAAAVESKQVMVAKAAALPRDPDRAVAFPHGSSNFRALLIDRFDKVVDQFELLHPSDSYEDLTHATAAALLHFGCLPAVGAAFLAGPVPKRGLLRFSNVKEWDPFDRAENEVAFGFKTDWLNDGAAGYYGLLRLDTSDFTVLRTGKYRRGDAYLYAIFGTGLNTGGPQPREDGHLLFVPRSEEEVELQRYLKNVLGHWPEWEDVVSGGTGFRLVADYFLDKNEGSHESDFAREYEETPHKKRGAVVTRFALAGDSVASAAAKQVFESLGSWLGAMAISHQVTRIDLSPGILSDEIMRHYCLKETGFTTAFEDQGRPMFKEVAQNCTVRVCRRNPEHEGAVERAAELLRLRG